MKDYKLSEIKEICNENECEKCPFFNDIIGCIWTKPKFPKGWRIEENKENEDEHS